MSRVLAAIVLILLAVVAERGAGPMPPLGPTLDPVRGIWAVARNAELPRSARARIPGLSAPVRVMYDARGVPHIFAATQRDAWRALGWVVARDRLFQLELQTRAANGTLTELLGARALPLDEETRALGLPRAAEQKLASLDRSSTQWQAMVAYADGVNAYIDQLRERDLPIEYRLLRARPARWEPINSIHLLDRMGLTLAYDPEELRRLRVAVMVGERAAAALLPRNSPIQEPIQPNGMGGPRLDSAPLPPPGPPDTAARRALAMLHAVTHRYAAAIARSRLPASLAVLPNARPAGDGDAVGSNNWAVAPARSRDGHALLAGDPHLDLTLPSIWYEVQLVVPGKLDVYGVTIPGAPGIIIGFNRDVAWTFTNTGADVLDFYAESVDVRDRPARTLLDGTWRPVERRVEVYRDQHGTVIRTDTALFTARGPLRRIGSRWLSMRWTVLAPRVTLTDFLALAGARSAREWLDAMRTFDAPAQNMLVADRAGNIAIRSTGRFPLRPGDGRGDEIRDGTTSASDWTGVWPLAKYPQAFDPARGFLFSANQQPLDPRQDDTYLGADWPAPWRAMRIAALLRADSQVTPNAMRRFQTDPGSARADLFVPYFLRAAERAAPDDTLRRAAALLGQWDRRYTTTSSRAVLFELAMAALEGNLWDELVPPGMVRPVVLPSESVVAELLANPRSPWWDDHRTTAVETRDDILARSLRVAYVAALRLYGTPDAGGWTWSRIRHQNIYHLLRIAPFSRLNLAVQGGPGTLNPSVGAGTHGSSWRMVVDLGPTVQAWGALPGGESGNPVSPRYDDHLPQWLAGTLQPLVFPPDTAAMRKDGVMASVVLEGR